MSDKIPVVQCDSCGHQVWGLEKKEAHKDGWRWHDAGPGRTFVCCDECEDKYATRRINRARVLGALTA